MQYEKIETNALNHRNDTIVLYYVPDEHILTDDGYTYQDAFKRDASTVQLAQMVCKQFFCCFNEAKHEFTYPISNPSDKEIGVIRLIQAITMFDTLNR